MQKLNGGLSIKTVKDILIVLKMVMKFGVKDEWTNYCEWDIKYPTTETNKEIEVLTVAHHKKILDFIKQNFTFRNLGIYISLTTGLRIGEICGLKWSDINTDNGTITVNRAIERIYIVEGERKHTELVINTPKTKNSCREIPMNKELLAMVKPLKKVVNTDFYVLTNEEKPTEPRTYRNYYHRLMARLDVPRLKYHGLRHSFATRCIESNCDYKTVSVLLGHANITTTLNLYIHPNIEQKKKVHHQDVQVFGKIRHYTYMSKRVCNKHTLSCIIIYYGIFNLLNTHHSGSAVTITTRLRSLSSYGCALLPMPCASMRDGAMP